MKAWLQPERALYAAGLLLAIVSGGQIGAEPMAGASLAAAIAGGAEAESLTRLVAGLLFVSALAVHLLRSRVVTIPRPRLFVFFTAFGVIVIASAVPSQFKGPALEAGARWLVVLSALAATTALVGRGRGPWAASAIIVGGAALLAVKGIQEYGSMRSIEPSYRIFAGWNNPNALAGVFAGSIPFALAWAALKDRRARLAGIGAAFLLAFGLILTQSRGGYLAAGVGVIAFSAAAFAWTRSPRSLIGLAGVAAGAAMIPLLSATAAKPGAAAPGALARIASGGQAETQSAGFRIQLWQSAIDMVESSPVIGHGPGSFRWLSAAGGRTPQTQFAHQAWLETAAESGLPALIVLVGAGFLWLSALFKGARSLAAGQNLLRAASLAAVMALAAHGFVDSVFSFLGLAVLFFAALGLGLLTSLDGVTPEMTPSSYRFSAAALGILAVFGLGLPPALSEARLSSALEAAASRDAAQTQGALESLGDDGEEGLLKARLMQALGRPPEERIAVLNRASASLPSPKTFRALADAHEEAGEIDKALAALDGALRYDPRNLPARSRRLAILRRADRIEEAIQEAEALIGIESAPYFQVRALGELVPTETYQARFWLASQKQGLESAEIAAAGVRGLQEYAKLTVPLILRFAEAGQSYAGESGPEAAEKLREAIAAAESAAEAYRIASRETEAEDLRKAASELASALSGLEENSDQRRTS